MPQTHLPPFWNARVLYVVGAKPTVENLHLGEAQQRAEGGSAKWNPWNCTLDAIPCSMFNDSGVQNYDWPIVGTCAQAMTLAGRDQAGKLQYPGILGDLQAGTKTAREIVQDNKSEFIKWAGGNEDYPSLILSILNEV